MSLLNRYQGSIIGLAIGDALGAPVEFKARGSFPPISDYQDGGPFNLKAGQWTDDTSLALCLGLSLIEKKTFDPHDQMTRYLKWFREGYMSCTGHCFDIGNTTKAALLRFEEKGDIYSGSPDDPASNGSLMRLAPVPLFYYPDTEKAIHYAGLSSKVTHAPAACIESCKLLSLLIVRALKGMSKVEIFADINTDFLQLSYEELSGKGEAWNCLNSALWCFYHSPDFETGVLRAVNLGDDTDTTAAVYGQIAGAFYGLDQIPARFQKDLWERDLLLSVAEKLLSKN